MHRRPKSIFMWEIQLPLGLLCIAAYFYFLKAEERREPVLIGIGVGALISACYEFYHARRLKKEANQPPESPHGK